MKIRGRLAFVKTPLKNLHPRGERGQVLSVISYNLLFNCCGRRLNTAPEHLPRSRMRYGQLVNGAQQVICNRSYRKGPALAEGRPHRNITPRRTRTPNLLVRSQTLYPIELWAQMAEREGFEPSVECYPYNRLAGGCLQPLGHLSAVPFPLWRRARDSNPQGLAPGGFQIRCLTS